MLDPLNTELIKYASGLIGKENIGISSSGIYITEEWAKEMTDYINDFEVTLDSIPFKPYSLRPIGYHEYASNSISILRKNKIKVGVQTILTKENYSKNNLKNIFEWLEKNEVNEWSLLRFFPSGRGKNYKNITPTHNEYCTVIDYIKEISFNSLIDVHFQYLLPNHGSYTLNCRAVKKSVGILPDGTCVSCFWRLDEKTEAKENKYILGNLSNNNFQELLNSKASDFWKNQNKCIIFTEKDLS